jgi:hypothetical protein
MKISLRISLRALVPPAQNKMRHDWDTLLRAGTRLHEQVGSLC